MEKALTVYFLGEQQAMLLLMLIGATSVIAALLLWRSRWRYRLAYWPFLIAAVPQLAVGAFVYFRSAVQLEEYTLLLQIKPNFIIAAELERMLVVVDRFQAIKLGEIIIMLACLLIAALYRHRYAVLGVTFGLCLQTSAMLAVDWSAESRATLYLQSLMNTRQLSTP